MSFPKRLVDGYRSFVGARLPLEQDRYRQLSEIGQRPEIMVIGCCDSRVSPEVIFDARPGELFVARNVANLVPPHSPDGFTDGVSAALEFAVLTLAVRHIVVLGHARCGGVRAFVEQGMPLSPGNFVGRWISLIAPAAGELGERGDHPLAEYLTRLEQRSTVRTLGNLMSFPCVRRRVENGQLRLHAAYFDVASGLLQVYDPDRGEFGELVDA